MIAENEYVSGCPEYEVLLEDYLDGALDNGSSRKVSEHLKVCVGCSLALENATAASQWLRATEPASDPGPAFARIVMARIRQEEDTRGRTSFWEPFVSLAWKFATTAALALVLMLVYASRGNDTVAVNSTASTIAIPSDVQDMLVATQSDVPATRSDMVRMVTESDNADQ